MAKVQEEQASYLAMDVIGETEAVTEMSEYEQNRKAEAVSEAEATTDKVNIAKVAVDVTGSNQRWTVAGVRKKKKASVDAPRKSNKGELPKFKLAWKHGWTSGTT